MILESLKSAPAKVLHIYDLSKCDGSIGPEYDPESDSYIHATRNEFKIGRSVESDMKIADISVSRVHSYIRFIGDNIYIEDNGSKFGTMIRIDKPVKILEAATSKKKQPDGTPILNSNIFQIGRTMLYFRLEPKKTEKKSLKLEEIQQADESELMHYYSRFKGTVFGSKIREKRPAVIDQLTKKIIMDDNIIPSEFVEPEVTDTLQNTFDQREGQNIIVD